jgi:transcription elongation factor Elf1
MEGDLNSIVNCPVCGKEVSVTLEKDNDDIETILENIHGMKIAFFMGIGKCESCGAEITTSLSISANTTKE